MRKLVSFGHDDLYLDILPYESEFHGDYYPDYLTDAPHPDSYCADILEKPEFAAAAYREIPYCLELDSYDRRHMLYLFGKRPRRRR